MPKHDDRAQSFSGTTRLPAWRYILAKRAVTSGQVLLASRVDAETWKLAQYLQSENECANEASRRRIQGKYAPLSQAVEIYREPCGERSCLIEALVLAREPTREIAERTEVPEDVIACYRTCFFAIGEYLDDRAYIMRYAIRSRRDCQPDLARRQGAMKLIAYCCGSDAIYLFLLSGEKFPREKWQAPSELMGRLASTADWHAVLSLADSTDTCVQIDPMKVLEHWEQIILRIKAYQPIPQPTTILERTAQRMANYL